MKKIFFTLSLVFASYAAFSQPDMEVLPDSSDRQLFSDFIGIRLWAGNYGFININENVHFKYVANSAYTMKHDLNVIGLNNMPNLGIGAEEDLGKHLLINFFNISLGYIQHTWNWNLGCGIGYWQALDKKKNARLRLSANLFYEDISYSLGSYYDTTGFGFSINGVGIGSSIKNVKYVNNTLSYNLCLDFLYRTPNLDFFAGASYNHVLYYNEKINFYYTKIPISSALFDDSNNPISSNVLNLNNYIIQAGVIREFGL